MLHDVCDFFKVQPQTNLTPHLAADVLPEKLDERKLETYAGLTTSLSPSPLRVSPATPDAATRRLADQWQASLSTLSRVRVGSAADTSTATRQSAAASPVGSDAEERTMEYGFCRGYTTGWAAVWRARSWITRVGTVK